MPAKSDQSTSNNRPVTVPDFLSARTRSTRLCVLTCYDYTTARLLDDAGVDALLVGDSLGMVVQGHKNSLSVTLDEMIYHTRCVARGAQHAMVIADLPFMSYQLNPEQALASAGRLVKEGGAHAIKLEGGERCAAAIAAITNADIPVMAHIGLTPQSVHRIGGFKVQRSEEKLFTDAKAVEQGGAFAVVVECVPSLLATRLTNALQIPTIGIGAGAGCDGQVLVVQDMLGMYGEFRPRFVKRYADLGEITRRAAESFCQEVRSGVFPGPEHEFH